MLRWFLIPKNRFLKIYLHKFMRSDEDRALHDHPWSFLSIILRGGYFEISETFEGKKTTLVRNGFAFMRTEEGRLTIQWPKNLSAYRPATFNNHLPCAPRVWLNNPAAKTR